MSRPDPEAQLYTGYLRIPILGGKGCILVLSPEEYLRALDRGKRVLRAQQHAKRARKPNSHAGGRKD